MKKIEVQREFSQARLLAGGVNELLRQTANRTTPAGDVVPTTPAQRRDILRAARAQAAQLVDQAHAAYEAIDQFLGQNGIAP